MKRISLIAAATLALLGAGGALLAVGGSRAAPPAAQAARPALTVAITQPRREALARSMGVPSIRADEPEAIRQAITLALGRDGPSLIEIDALDFHSPREITPVGKLPTTAYLQYTSGSTRAPAGVISTI